MSQDKSCDGNVSRQQRVRRLKRTIVYALLTLIIIPVICCIFLLCRVRNLDTRIDALEAQIACLEREYSVLSAKEEAQIQKEPVTTETEEPEMDKDKEDTARKVYLTFDDGPGVNTDKILDILAEYDVKATFFVVGKEDEASKDAIRRIVAEGHTLGMHSYSHKYAELYASEESFKADFEKQRTYLEELTGISCRFYRFPGGSSNTVSNVDMQLLADYLDSQGVVFHDWNIASGDGGRKILDVDTLVRNSTADVVNWKRAVVLLHDSAEKSTTVDALPRIIETIQAMEDTVLLPITENTVPVQHIERATDNGGTD